MNAKSPTLPPIPAKTGPGRKRPGPVPRWGLKLGGVLTTPGAFLATNPAVRALHDWTPWIIIPAAPTHIVALLLDATARIGSLDVFVPFLKSYGQLAIGLGTISVDLLIVVLVTTWIRRRMSNNSWQWWHRVSYLGFVTMFLHSMLSGTDLTSPVIAALSWASAIGIGYYALERLGKALNPARIR